ncbi:hypothetical protein CEXT_482661 [Caerostris extrusa]|uniref:Uncharacterized protein n=1 Tax=Caerostris extrusa TaxID=172846 RepID=A0AAV4WHK5_CAEEX|nr:hypothetical protein CEXT_482661 [Caerostris extrusa]
MNRVSVDRSISGRSNPNQLAEQKDSASLFPLRMKSQVMGESLEADLRAVGHLNLRNDGDLPAGDSPVTWDFMGGNKDTESLFCKVIGLERPLMSLSTETPLIQELCLRMSWASLVKG